MKNKLGKMFDDEDYEVMKLHEDHMYKLINKHKIDKKRTMSPIEIYKK